MGVQNNAAIEASRKIFWFIPSTATFCGTLVANEVKKFFQMNLLGGKTAVWKAVDPVPLPGYVTAFLLEQTVYLRSTSISRGEQSHDVL